MTKQIFISYARKDARFAGELAEALRDSGIKVWLDADQLIPGQDFFLEIRKAVAESDLLIVIFSKVATASNWIAREAELAVQAGIPVAPVILESSAALELPASIRSIQYADLSNVPETERIHQLVEQILRILPRLGPKKTYLPSATDDLANEMRAGLTGKVDEKASLSGSPAPNSIFVVHGHDETMLQEVTSFLVSVGVEPVVMKQVGGADQSLFQRFLRFTHDTNFAVALLSADDLGAARLQYEFNGVADRALRYRARQNVILELGFFYGSLGWENVFVLEKPPKDPFPDFERPSDLSGVLFDKFPPNGAWKDVLRKRLIEHGFALSGG